MMQNPPSARVRDWSNLPSIPDYLPDQRTSPQVVVWRVVWPVALALGVIILNARIKPLPWWWAWLWFFIFGALCLRAIRISSSWRQRGVFVVIALLYIAGWVAPHLFLTSNVANLWEQMAWPIFWPSILEGLTIWLNRRSALLPWWWHWARPSVVAAILVIVGIVIGRWSV
ncbi:MAG TPA: hypothetical protein VFV38_14370 [Ktedonobacteraceae bacterium]|nr:hypothetical protein [Ktedonobacteraceae bacterium]